MESPQGLEGGAESCEGAWVPLCERGHPLYIEEEGGGLAPLPCKEGEREREIDYGRRGQVWSLLDLSELLT